MKIVRGKPLWEQHQQRGSILPAALTIIFASTLLATGALRSAITATRLASSVQSSAAAFWLAELGLQKAADYAQLHAGNLPNDPLSTPLRYPPHDTINNPAIELSAQHIAGQGSFTATISYLGSDTDCPAMATPDAVRYHFEIRATGRAILGASYTHVQGLYLCRENCGSDFCIGHETELLKSYWKSIPGSSH